MGVVEGEGAGFVQRGRVMHGPAPASSNSEVSPIRYPAFGKASGLNWRAKASTYKPTQSTSVHGVLLQTPAKEGERLVKAGRLTDVYHPAPKHALT